MQWIRLVGVPLGDYVQPAIHHCHLVNCDADMSLLLKLPLMLHPHPLHVHPQHWSNKSNGREIHENCHSITFYFLKKKKTHFLIVAGSAFYQV